MGKEMRKFSLRGGHLLHCHCAIVCHLMGLSSGEQQRHAGLPAPDSRGRMSVGVYSHRSLGMRLFYVVKPHKRTRCAEIVHCEL